MFMIMLVLNDNTHLDRVLDAWAGLGVSGTTIVESTGQYRRRLGHIPMRYTYGEVPSQEIRNSTLFAMVPDEDKVRSCLEAAEHIVGDLDGPNTGVFSAWPLAITKGIPARGHS